MQCVCLCCVVDETLLLQPHHQTDKECTTDVDAAADYGFATDVAIWSSRTQEKLRSKDYNNLVCMVLFCFHPVKWSTEVSQDVNVLLVSFECCEDSVSAGWCELCTRLSVAVSVSVGLISISELGLSASSRYNSIHCVDNIRDIVLCVLHVFCWWCSLHENEVPFYLFFF